MNVFAEELSKNEGSRGENPGFPFLSQWPLGQISVQTLGLKQRRLSLAAREWSIVGRISGWACARPGHYVPGTAVSVWR